MKTKLEYLAIISIVSILFTGIGCIDQEKQEKNKNENSAVPGQSEMTSAIGDISTITPVYFHPLIHNITAWKVDFNKGNYSGEADVRNSSGLARLTANISLVQKTGVIDALESQGCFNISINPVNGEVVAQIGKSKAFGSIGLDNYIVISGETLLCEPNRWGQPSPDGMCHSSWRTLRKVAKGIFLEEENTCYEHYYLYRVYTMQHQKNITAAKINELNTLLGKNNVTLRF